ncbi:nucleotidyltransferase family protein [Maricurvus nonylphenolicus]|uniref:nucleotidyltransferase family protein n=1 Tax=Maricurvus nonylphenolicus TaxID=1008307 RepID=UPI0036F3CE61
MKVGLLLAAGQGSRFGGDKCLAPLADGTPLVLQAARNLQGAVDHLVVIARPGDSALQQLMRDQGFTVVACDKAHLGMAESLKCGVAATPSASGWLIAFADMPFIQPASYQAVADSLSSDDSLCVPFCQDKQGHPVGFGCGYRQLLLALQGDVGARSILKQYPDKIQRLTLDDAGIVWDIDRPEDLQQANKQLSNDQKG